jgi:glutaconate CoA-transferase subunit A
MARILDRLKSKLLSLQEAIERYVPDGAEIALGTCLEILIPFGAGHEMIRQGKRNLTLVGPISDALFDQLIGAGCVAKVRAAWVGNVITGSAYNFRRWVESGRLQVEDHSNLTMAMGLRAGALGIPFIPTLTALGSDLFQTNASLSTVICPFSGARLAAVAAITPDVTIIHVQRSDPFGNAHAWGNLGVARDACLASRNIIITAEEIVAPDTISADPNRVITPGYRVSAVAHAPWGAYPSAVPGFYNRDHQAFIDYRDCSRKAEGFEAWCRRWIDRESGIDGTTGPIPAETKDRLQINRHVRSDGVDFGY